jgi:hypothetical protein
VWPLGRASAIIVDVMVMDVLDSFATRAPRNRLYDEASRRYDGPHGRAGGGD